MPIVADSEFVQSAVEIAVGEIDATLESIDVAMGNDAVGMGNPTAQELAAFVFHQQVLFPPQQFQYPDGTVVTGSPWILALQYCENGQEWLGRFTRFVARISGGI